MPLRSRVELNQKDKKHIENMLKALDEFGVDAERVLLNEADKTVKKMKSQVPVDTGRLRRNIHAQTLTTGGVEIISEARDPETGEYYDVIIEEFGGRHQKGKGFFRRGIRNFRTRLSRTLSKMFRDYTSLGSSYRSRKYRR